MSTALVCDYQPSQPTGWPPNWGNESLGATIGGHQRSADFVHNELGYRISLTGEPVYETAPSTRFTRTLQSAFGATYAFRYAGGVAEGKLRVQSYSVAVIPPSDEMPLVTYGADLYLTYEGEPQGRAARFIHVLHTSGGLLGDSTTLDNSQRANPYALSGGSTSVNGRRVTNFYATFAASPAPDEPDLTGGLDGEAFLVWDLGAKDGSGRGRVTVAGGVRYGWSVTKVAS